VRSGVKPLLDRESHTLPCEVAGTTWLMYTSSLRSDGGGTGVGDKWQFIRMHGPRTEAFHGRISRSMPASRPDPLSGVPREWSHPSLSGAAITHYPRLHGRGRRSSTCARTGIQEVKPGLNPLPMFLESHLRTSSVASRDKIP
jgi:hypothetical protein